MALRKYLCHCGGNWYHALPVAVWGLNDPPGIVAPYSLHRLVIGRDPPGLGDCPPYVLAHANCIPFFSPKHLDFVTEKIFFFAILKILFFKPSQKMHFSSFLPIFCCF